MATAVTSTWHNIYFFTFVVGLNVASQESKCTAHGVSFILNKLGVLFPCVRIYFQNLSCCLAKLHHTNMYGTDMSVYQWTLYFVQKYSKNIAQSRFMKKVHDNIKVV